MQIYLLDPGLLSVSGHHLEWDLRAVEELTSLGHRVIVFANARVDSQVVESFSDLASVSPLFRIYPYADPSAFDPIVGELRFFLEGGSVIAKDLSRIDECDLWLWPSLFAPQLYASAIAAPAQRMAGCIHCEPRFQAANGRMWWRYAFLSAQRARLRTNIGVTISQLQEEFAPLTTAGQIECFPAAHDGAPTGIRRTSLTRIGFFGHQRMEKGAALLPELVSRLLQDGFQIVLHDSGNLVRIESAPGLTVLGYVPRLAEEIAKCDLVIVPYDSETYRSRGSGIVFDAVASGVPVIVPSGTAPARLVEEAGSGKTINNLSIDEVRRAIFGVQKNYEQISMAAFEASRRWRAIHGVKPFVAAMVRETVPAS